MRRRPTTSTTLAFRSLLAIAAALALAAAAPRPLAAQKGAAAAPQRPRLAPDADTNDPDAYFEYGNLRETPWKKSQDAFYWAYRLDPRQPVFLLAQWQALWMKQSPEWRQAYREGAEYAVKSKESKQLDSLLLFLMTRDPFAHFSGGCYLPSWIDQVDDPFESGWIRYDGMCYGQAAEQWAKVLAKRPGLAGLRIDRAKALHFSHANGLALQELQTALDTLRARDDKKLRHVYESKEMLEYMIGMIQIEEENYAAAREAFGRALTENLSFYQAHARIGDIDLLQGDPAAAIAEYDQAAQLNSDDPVLRDNYGVALMRASKPNFADAETQFRKAIELAPEYPNPYYNLAVALTHEGRKAEAVAQYQEFVDRAPRRELTLITNARKAIAVLNATPAATATGTTPPSGVKP